MRERLHATAVIARTQVTELLLSPGPYAALAAGMAIGWVLCSGFARAIDSSGFDPRLDAVWDFVTRAFSGAFGPVFVERLMWQRNESQTRMRLLNRDRPKTRLR